ncbi:quinon protein alcohol dehydrogenase-like superfamily [Suillus subaureus]|uniref:Quinon protein alcohol dehydrogenase-like superfamily n=1 Tax=Suillus subaureus TaxID=48587 RepID=A0A9P7E8N6_9AGAM|nr:quinon protein alcohol dehydrogenase-like superfamily [Suillus subaureus]KAG1814017.1 quinon protein alcohol dehydrogenase-like superfamily [Suillus subaureus]
MASSSTQPGETANKLILTPVMTLEGHEPWISPGWSDENGHPVKSKDISSMSYFPDGRQMISGSHDQTIRRWDLRKGKEIEKAREVCENRIDVVGVSRNGRWVVTAGGSGELKVSEVETGTARTLHEDKWPWPWIRCIDISADSTLVAGGSDDSAVRIWSLDTGKLMAGPFGSNDNFTRTLRLSADSRKLAALGRRLQVWDVQTQKLDVQKYTLSTSAASTLPVFWTTKDKSIIAADGTRTIHEFDASTLKTVGAPFKEHPGPIMGLALSSDCVLLVSSSLDQTIKLWSFQSRQLLASFDVQNIVQSFTFSPDSRQLAYTNFNDCNIYICNIPANVLASIGLAEEPQPIKLSRHAGLLNSDATRRHSRKPVIAPVMSPISHPPRPLPAGDPHTLLRFLRKLLSSSSRTDAVLTDEPRNPLDFSATLPLPRPLIKPDENSRPTPAPPTTQSSIVNTSLALKSSLHRLSTWWPFQTDHASPAIALVPLAPGKLRVLPGNDDDDLIRDEGLYFSSSFPQSRLTPRDCQRRTAWKRPVLFLLLTEFELFPCYLVTVTVITRCMHCLPTLISSLWLLYPFERSRYITVPMVDPVHHRSRSVLFYSNTR